jgi:ribosomal-protein-alanine N-acetyltransferase
MRVATKRTVRLTVRSPRATDEEAFTELARASRRFHAGLVSPPVTAAGFRAYLARNEENDFAAFLFVESATGRIAGVANISQIFLGNFRSAYLGYWIGAMFARQGLMQEGLAAVLTAAFGPLGLHRVEANIQPENEASRRVAQRLGFRQEGYSPRYLKIAGRWRDHERWTILREDWRRRRKPAQ